MPIVTFLTHKDDFSDIDARNAAFVVAHIGFIMFNFLNFIYITLFQGVAFRQLGKNHVLKIAMLACLLQMCSCVTSITRYNINDEFGFYAHAGTAFGLLAYIPFNITYLYLIFHRNTRAIRLGMLFWIALSTATFLIGEKNWDKKNFAYFRPYVAVSTLYQVIALFLGHQALKEGSISINASIISTDAMLRVFKVLLLADIAAMLGAATGVPVIIYPGTGSTFTVMVIAMTYVGRMDFMTTEDGITVAEMQPLKNAV